MSLSAPKLTFNYSESDINKMNNTSKLTVKVSVVSNGDTWRGTPQSGYLIIGGEKKTFSHTYGTGTTLVYTGSKTIKHNNSGSTSVSIKASFNTGSSYWGTITKTDTKSLPEINRKYKITFNKNGGSGGPTSQTGTLGSSITLTTKEPTLSGYNFLGWSTSKTATSASYTGGHSYSFSSNTTLYAVWKEKTYKITYNSNNPKGGSSVTNEVTKRYKTSLGAASNSWTYSGYAFVSWNTAANGTGDNYPPGKALPNKTMSLFAQWKQSTYKVEYVETSPDYNIVTGSLPATISSQAIEENFTVGNFTGTLSNNYTFDGWVYNGKIVMPGKQISQKKAEPIQFVMRAVQQDYDPEVTDFNFTRYDSEGQESAGGHGYKYNFSWRPGKSGGNVQTIKSIVVSDNNGFTYTYTNPSSPINRTEIINDFGHSETLTITFNIEQIDAETQTTEIISIKREFDITTKEDDNIPMVLTISNFSRKTGDNTLVSGTLNWTGYYDGNQTHKYYEFIFQLDGVSFYNYTVSNSSSGTINFESSDENPLEIDKKGELSIIVSSKPTSDSTDELYQQKNLIIIGDIIIYPISLVFHVGSTGKAIGFFRAVEEEEEGVFIDGKVEINETLKVTGETTINNTLNVATGIVLNNNQYIQWYDKSGTIRPIMYLTESNNLSIGYYLKTEGVGSTYIHGKHLYLYGSEGIHIQNDMYTKDITMGNSSDGLKALNAKKTGTYTIGYVSSSNNVVIGDSNANIIIRGKNKGSKNTYILNSSGFLTLGSGINCGGNITIPNTYHYRAYGSNNSTAYNLIGLSSNENVLVGSNSSDLYLYGITSTTYAANLRVGMSDGSPTYRIYYAGSSSKRYKHDIQKLEVLDKKTSLDPSKLYDLQVCSFKYNDGYLASDDLRSGKDIPGFIAEEVGEIYPIAMDKNEDGLPEDWNVRYIVPPMLALIQEQKKQIDKLEQRVAELEK